METKIQSYYTIEDIYNLPAGERAELINGEIYMMAPPSATHQEIVTILVWQIKNYLMQKNSKCKIYPAPFAVFLNDDENVYLEPDISVICGEEKIDEKGCHGAPDFIVEIVSPGSRKLDYYKKLALYQEAGVREYWIVDPARKTILVYLIEEVAAPVIYGFSDSVKVGILDALEINLQNFL